ncbi:MAG: recombinase family protein [Rhodobacteraceae bacterium]|nr:recombinase family protein [Paracoccaceae bacterium]
MPPIDSTQEQRPDRQIDGLLEICDELFIERASATARKRPVYDQVFKELSTGEWLVVWDLERAFRSVINAILEVERLKARGIGVEIVDMRIDTTTSGGMLIYTVLSAFAEFECRMLSQRTREGLSAARKRGKPLCHPSKLSSKQIDAAIQHVRDGARIGCIAKELSVAPWTLRRSIERRSARHTLAEFPAF